MQEEFGLRKEGPEGCPFGELLFPSFNVLVPQFTEFVFPNLTKIPQKDSSVLLQTFFSIVNFAFKTQVFEKKIPTLLKKSAYSNSFMSQICP